MSPQGAEKTSSLVPLTKMCNLCEVSAVATATLKQLCGRYKKF